MAPYALLALPVGLVLGGLALRVRYQRRRRWLAFLSTSSQPPLPAWRLEALGLAFSWVCLTFALARPFVGYTLACAPAAQKVCYLAVDVSRSMEAADLGASRLEQAKAAIQGALVSLQDTDVAVGLIAFGGLASCECPPTQDYALVWRLARQLTTGNAGKGTDLAAPIAWVLGTSSAEPSAGVLVIFSDGEGTQPAPAVLQKAAQQAWVIHTVGVGTAAGGPIPMPGGHAYLKDATGKVVVTALQAQALQAIAQATGGTYRPLQELGSLVPLCAQASTGAQEGLHKVPRECYAWGILLGTLPLLRLMLAEAGRLPWQKSSRKAPPPSGSLNQATKAVAAGPRGKIFSSTAGCIVLGCVLFCPVKAVAHWAQVAQHAYTSGDYAAAYQAYAQALQQADCSPGCPDYPAVCYNAGTAAYQAGQYAQAIGWLQQAQAAAGSLAPKTQASMAYNLGNACCRAGQIDKLHQQALWQQALQHYEQALVCWPQHPFAAANAAWVKRQLQATCQPPKTRSALPRHDHLAPAQEAWLQALERQQAAGLPQPAVVPQHTPTCASYDW